MALVVALAGDGTAPRSAQRLAAATLKPLESAESGLEEELRIALAPAALAAAPIRAVPGGPGPPGTQAGMEEGEKPRGVWTMSRLGFLKTGLRSFFGMITANVTKGAQEPLAPSDVAQTIRAGIHELSQVTDAIRVRRRFGPSPTHVAHELALQKAARAWRAAEASLPALSRTADGQLLRGDFTRARKEYEGVVRQIADARKIAAADDSTPSAQEVRLLQAVLKGPEAVDRWVVVDGLPEVLQGEEISTTSAREAAILRPGGSWTQDEWTAHVAQRVLTLTRPRRDVLYQESQSYLQPFDVTLRHDLVDDPHVVQAVLEAIKERVEDPDEDVELFHGERQLLKEAYSEARRAAAIASPRWQREVVAPLRRRWRDAGLPLDAFDMGHAPLFRAPLFPEQWIGNLDESLDRAHGDAVRDWLFERLKLHIPIVEAADGSRRLDGGVYDSLQRAFNALSIQELEQGVRTNPSRLYTQLLAHPANAVGQGSPRAARDIHADPESGQPPEVEGVGDEASAEVSYDDPVAELAHQLAVSAETQTVLITVRLAADGALADLTWQPVNGPRAEATSDVLADLRDAGWPRGGAPDDVYVWSVAPGASADDLTAQLQRPLTDPAWERLDAVAPVRAATELRAVPGGPGPPGAQAGMEEGNPEPPAKPGEMSLRTFLKTTGLIPRVAQQMVAGAAPAPVAASAGAVVPADAATLATARLVSQFEMLQRFLSLESVPEDWDLAVMLAPVAASLARVKPTPEGQWPPDVVAAIHNTQTAVPELTHAQGWLVQVATQRPEHFELARTLIGFQRFLQWRIPVHDWLRPQKLLEAYVRSGGPPLATDAQRRDYLRPLLSGRLQALAGDLPPARQQQLEALTTRILEHSERLLTPYYTVGASGEPTRWGVEGRLAGELRRFLNPRWGAMMREVERRWIEDKIPAELRMGVLRRQLDHARSDWLRRPGPFLEGMRLHGRLVTELSKRGLLGPDFTPGPDLAWNLSPEERAAALRDPGAWAGRLAQRVQAQRAGVVQDLWAQWNPAGRGPSLRALSRAEAEDVTLQVAERWGGRIRNYGRLPWVPPSADTGLAPLTLYAPVSWADTLTARWTPPERDATAVRTIPAITPDVPGVLLLDEAMPIPPAVAAMVPYDRPVILRVAHEDLRTVPYGYLAFLAAQPALRGQVLLWVPAFADQVTVDGAASYYLATEA